MESIFTERLELRPITLPVVVALLEGRRRSEIEAIVGAEMPWTWPSRALVEQAFEASLDAIVADPSKRLWGDRLMVTREASPRVIGSVVFHGRPLEDGVCEIAYGVEDASQGKGYATEALAATLAWALAQPECRIVRATTTTWHKASARVLEKVGMHLVNPGPASVRDERPPPSRDEANAEMRVYEIERSG